MLSAASAQWLAILELTARLARSTLYSSTADRILADDSVAGTLISPNVRKARGVSRSIKRHHAESTRPSVGRSWPIETLHDPLGFVHKMRVKYPRSRSHV